MSVSDIIKSLSTNVPLNAGLYFETNPVIAGEYTSLSITVFSDQDISALVSFSPDGISYDANITKSFLAGISSYENVVILSKWIKIRYTNTSAVNATVMRGYAYGSIQNTAVTAVLSGVGNKDAAVRVTNFPVGGFGDLRVGNITTEEALMFIAGNSTLCSANDIQSYSPDLRCGTSTGAGSSTVDFTDRMINLKMNGDINITSWIQSRTVLYSPGISSTYRFTMKFSLSDSDLGSTIQIGAGYARNGVRNDFYGFGWNQSGAPNTYDNFGIQYTIAGANFSVLRTAWNHDKADGTGDLAVLDLTKIQVCQIQQTYLGAGPIKFYLMTPAGEWVLVHVLQFAGVRTDTTARDPSYGLCMFGFVNTGAVISSGIDSVACGSFAVQHDGAKMENYESFVVNHSTLEKAISASTETVIYHLDNSTTYQGSSVHTPIDIHEISCSCDGTKNTFISFWRNCTTAGTSYAFVNNFTPLRKSEAGTVSAYGRLILQFPILKAGTELIELVDKINIQSGETITITAFSTGASDVSMACTYHIS
jgi:hypothetical protein